VDWEFRPVAAGDAAWVKERVWRYADHVLLPAMRAVHPGAAIETETIGEIDGLEPVPDSEAVRVVTELTGGNEIGVVSFGTEAGLFQRAGIPAVVCGPGSIDQAHKPDEFVALEQLSACLGMIGRLLPRLARPAR
jgi:acetylornithine deacetylase